jgi:hypothetical protein
MSEIKVNKISPRTACGTVTLGDSGDTFTIPSGATITNAGTASGFGATGETSWDTTVKTNGTFTATAGVGYFLNTTAGTITVNLAAGTAGDSVAMADYAGTWQTNNVTVAANGTEKIGGVDADVTLSTEGQSVTFVYIDGTQGWVNVLDSTSNVRGSPYIVATGGTPTQSGDYEIRTFTGPGTFTVCSAAVCGSDNAVDYLVVAGGGGGGATGGGAGGAGGFRETPGTSTGCYSVSPIAGSVTALTVTATGYPVAVGGGGPGVAGPVATGVSGSVSTFNSQTSAGGGGGATGNAAGLTGGSGGGGGGGTPGPTPYPGGAGNTPPTSPSQGFTGGNGYDGVAVDNQGGGGGGASAVGANAAAQAGGNGGAGVATSITGASVTRTGGGGGASDSPSGTPGTAGTGGGGAGAPQGPTSNDGTAGTVNTGGGGGAGSSPGATSSGAAGGSGVVILRYKFQN